MLKKMSPGLIISKYILLLNPENTKRLPKVEPLLHQRHRKSHSAGATPRYFLGSRKSRGNYLKSIW